jgi:hypothetical protein
MAPGTHAPLQLVKPDTVLPPEPGEPPMSGLSRGKVIRDQYPPPGVVVLRAIADDGAFVEARIIREERYTEAMDEELYQVLDDWHRLRSSA